MPAGSILGSDKEATSAESWGEEKTGTKQTIYYNLQSSDIGTSAEVRRCSRLPFPINQTTRMVAIFMIY